MRYFKSLMMGAFLTVFLAMTVSNAATYQKMGDVDTSTTALAADSVLVHINSNSRIRLFTLTEINASAANIGASTIVTVGALNAGSVTSGFGNYDSGTGNITSGGTWFVDVDADSSNVIGSAGAISYGASADSGVGFDGTDHVISSSVDIKYSAAGDDHIFLSSGATVATIDETGIDIVTNNFTTGGQYIVDVNGTAINAAGSVTLGASNDAGLWFDGTDLIISSSTDIKYDADGDDHKFYSSGTLIATLNATGIDLEANNVRSGGIWRIDVDGTALGAVGSLGFGAGTDDSGLWWDGSDHIITSTGGYRLGIVEASTISFEEAGTVTARIDYSGVVSETSWLVLVDGTLSRVTVGADDSAEPGFRVLRVAN